MASGRCMNKLVEVLLEAVVKEAAQVDDVRENSKVIAIKASTPVCQEISSPGGINISRPERVGRRKCLVAIGNWPRCTTEHRTEAPRAALPHFQTLLQLGL